MFYQLLKDTEKVNKEAKRSLQSLKLNESKLNGKIRFKSKLKIKEAVGKQDFVYLQQLSKSGKEGLVILGAGGNPEEWVTGISEILQKEGIAKSPNIFSETFILTGNVKGEEGRTDLALVFGDEELNMGKMAMWRLQFGDASWISDFVVNFAEDYGAEPAEDTDADDEEAEGEDLDRFHRESAEGSGEVIDEKQADLDSIKSWLADTTEEFDDWDWDGKTLTIFLNGKAIEKYTKEDLIDAGAIRKAKGKVEEMALSGTKYIVTGQAYDRATNKPIGKQRDEEIDIASNELFKGVKSIGDIENKYESFWNSLNPKSKEIVKVRAVKPAGKNESKVNEANETPQNLTLDDIVKVYTGKPNTCMCGCAGVYKYSSKHIDEMPDYYKKDPKHVDDKRVMKVYKNILSAPIVEITSGYIYTAEIGSTQYSMYLDEGKYSAKESKVKEDVSFTGEKDPATHDETGATARQYEGI
jgi:hypothetical protein